MSKDRIVAIHGFGDFPSSRYSKSDRHSSVTRTANGSDTSRDTTRSTRVYLEADPTEKNNGESIDPARSSATSVESLNKKRYEVKLNITKRQREEFCFSLLVCVSFNEKKQQKKRRKRRRNVMRIA